MRNKCLLIIGACLGLSSCTPIEREVSEEIIEEVVHECGAITGNIRHVDTRMTTAIGLSEDVR